ncbi:MAG: response regulator [Desulfuromonadaceae bacterium]|nr:response regulator [Desulfuromonadaceae bacterium]MDD5105542.1 response regulator [Desulfuromonadaceae bacterium]
MTEEQSRVTVLLVDDEENILRALQRLLMDENFDVETAASGEAALAKLRTLHNVGLIVSDQRMPGMNGAEFLGYSREIAPDAVRILLTGYSDISATIDAINKGGASRYLSKPWNDDELVQAIRDAVRQYELIAENKRLNAIIVQQNDELLEWNNNLKGRVLQQTTAIRKKSEELQETLVQSRASYHGVIEALSNLVELRGKRTHQHSRNVATLAADAAKELGLKSEEIETIRIASLLLDIGEIGIPERILLITPDSMGPEEFREYSQHPVRAQLLLDNIEELRPAALLIRHHHELFDGSGFPDKLSGEQIPYGARIIAFADEIDRAAMTPLLLGSIADQSLARASLKCGSSLDPALHTVFKKVVSHFYNSGPKHEEYSTVELELKPEQLQPGMPLSRDLLSGSGLLLLHRGKVLDAGKIESVKRYYALDPAKSGVFVLVKR